MRASTLTISKRAFRSLLAQVCCLLVPEAGMYLYNYAVLLLRVSVLQVSRSSFQIGISHPSITMENSLSENTRQLSACLNAKPPGQRDKAIRDLSDGHPRPRAMLQDIHVGLFSPSHRRRLEYHKDLILVRRQRCRFMVVVQRWRKFSKVQR